MSNETLGLIQLALLSLAIFIGFPTAFTLLALGFVFGYVGFGHLVFDMMVQRAFFVMSNDVLISIVLFVFMGYVVERSGILDRLFRTILVFRALCLFLLGVSGLCRGRFFPSPGRRW